MGTLAAGIKDIFSPAKTTGTNVMLCGNDGTPDGHMTLNNLKNAILTFDTTPTENSTNPVTSAGIKAYVDPSLDVPIPFENENVKQWIINVYSNDYGMTFNGVRGFYGEITYRQAKTFIPTPYIGANNPNNYTQGGTFNELKYFAAMAQLVNFMVGSNISSCCLPNGVSILGVYSCSGSYIELPSTVTKINARALQNCTGTVKIYATTPPTLDIYSNNNMTEILVPKSALEAYQGDSVWSQYGSKLKGF